MASRNVLFFGATGTVGAPILNQVVLAKEAFTRIVVFTSSGGNAEKLALLQGWKDQGVEIFEGDITDEATVLKAFEGIDTIVSALGRTAIAHQIPLIHLADSAPQIRRFIPSEFGTDIEHSPSSASEKPHQQKLKVRAALRESTGLDYTFLVTGPYPDARNGMYLSNAHYGIGHWDVEGKNALIVGTGDERLGLTTVDDVGKFVVRTLTRPSSATHKAALRLKSFDASPHEILKEFEKQTGAKWEVQYLPLEELKKSEKEWWEAGDPRATPATLRRIWAEGGALYESWDNAVLGLDDRDLDSVADAVRKAIAVQKGQTKA